MEAESQKPPHMTEARRLRGHSDTATSCVTSRDKPGVVVTSGEDGRICWFDMRCKDVQLVMDVGEEPISSLCFNSGNEDIIYVSSGNEVKCFDVHMLAANSWRTLGNYSHNKEEINQVACNSKSSFLASADDGGEVKIIDIHQQSLFKTLRSGPSGHSSLRTVCSVETLGSTGSSYQLLVGRRHLSFSSKVLNSLSVITGGLDSKLIIWDFSKGRSSKVFDFGSPDVNGSSNAGQSFNPAFVHAIAVPDADMLDRLDKICVVARGDGIIDLINIDSQRATSRSKSSSKTKKGKQSAKGSLSADKEDQNRKEVLHLDYSVGGHTAAASCVAFSLFGEKGKFIISGGNDKSIKVWDSSRCLHSWKDNGSNNHGLLHLSIDLKKKVNWFCTTTSESENLVVCDTSKVVKVYTIS